MRALYTAATGMAAQELNVQVISNNIANLRTTGYKKQRAQFQDLIYEHVKRVGAQASSAAAMLFGRRRFARTTQTPARDSSAHSRPCVWRTVPMTRPRGTPTSNNPSTTARPCGPSAPKTR